ncbi:hypothetical protein DdX_07443 [Ditylenchus destructor]|uniref:Uncharacterized protein n=1 Tax=Ditylenchus destructor TaxID=166010 RepID=A0AAD4N9K5_9BILA|nr:hypothetical protein DdX_07443 [Ditylenchus destructor]
MAKSRIFRISGSHKSRKSSMFPAKPVPNSTQLLETKRLTYHTPGTELRSVICDMAKSRIFRISGSHKSRKSSMFPAKPVPIDSARRDEAIDVSHARNRAAQRFSGFPEATNPGNRRCSRRNRYHSTQLLETKRLTYHTPGTELRSVICDMAKSRIFRISGSHKSRKSSMFPAKPVPIDSAPETKRLTYHTPGTELRSVICDLAKSRIFRISGSHKSRKSSMFPAKPVPIDSAARDEAIDVSHARNRAAQRFSGFPEATNPGNRRCSRRNRYQSTQLAETKRLTYHTPGTELRSVICDLAKSRIFRISGSHKSRKSSMFPAKPVPFDSAPRDEAIDVSHARNRAAQRFSGFPEATNPGNRRCSRRNRYQSTQLAETKRLTYHTPGTELRSVICDMAKSRIFRISGSHKSRKSSMFPAKPVPIDSARRDEAIDVSHARNRAAQRFSGFPEATNPGNRRCSRRNRYHSTQLLETKRLTYHTPGTELRSVICDMAKSRIFRISGSHKSRKSSMFPAKPVPIDSAPRDEAIDVSHARNRAAQRFSGFPEATNPGNRRCSRRNRYQSTQLAETKRLTYHTPGTELRSVICDMAKSRIFRISGSHKSRKSSMFPAKPVPIDSARRDEAIDVSHARNRAAQRFSGFPEATNPGNRRCSRRNRYQSTQLLETKRLTYHTPGTELRSVICDMAKSRIFRISGSHKSRKSSMFPAKPVPFDSAPRDEAIDVSHARNRAAQRFSGFPEATNPGNRRCSRRNRYHSTQLLETKRLTYHTPGTELRSVICDMAKSRIFRISGSHKSRKSSMFPAKPVPIDSAPRDEAIDVSHARNRAAQRFSGFPEATNPGNRRCFRRNRYQSTQLAETKRLTYHTPGTELRSVICDLAKSRIFRISGSHKSRKSSMFRTKPVPIDSARRDEAIDVSHARNRAATRFSGFPEATNPGNRRCSRRNRYQSTQLAETKRLTYHTPGTELRSVICDLAKSRIFRISGSHKSRKSSMFPAKPVPIDSARRDEAIDVSHARNRAAQRDL